VTDVAQGPRGGPETRGDPGAGSAIRRPSGAEHLPLDEGIQARRDRPLEPARQRLLELLSTGPAPLYAVLDAARNLRSLYWPKEEGAEHESLYDGDTARNLELFAPYLVRLAPGTPLLRRLVAEAWGESWSVFCTCPLPLAELRKHFRRFLMVELDGKPVYFRFYDPRVLRVFLPTCRSGEFQELFGPVSAWLLEGESPDVLLRFSLGENGLVREEIQLEEPEAASS
jgi:hypothetical protein